MRAVKKRFHIVRDCEFCFLVSFVSQTTYLRPVTKQVFFVFVFYYLENAIRSFGHFVLRYKSALEKKYLCIIVPCFLGMDVVT